MTPVWPRLALLLIHVVFAAGTSESIAQVASPAGSPFLEFLRARAAALEAGRQPPESLTAWQDQRAKLRAELEAAWGGFPREACPLNPRKLGELAREGYRVEKIIFQTRPDVWMTANAYVPAGTGKHPAVLCVHGHWRGAKQDPVVQARCIGLVRHGFFVLVVDAFGSGERGIGKALGEYHGEMTGATLFPIGLPLSGLQVYENMRAVDYLRTRPEVDGEKIGITGASGGGNQTMYAGGWDERFGAVVPVCSVGNYQAYLGAACCMCEVVPGALRFTEEWGVLAMTAPRGLMIVNATRDAPQFSVAEARKSFERGVPIYRLLGQEQRIRHAIFESPHDYNREMREAMYGWMKLHLAGAGDGSPLPEAAQNTEAPEALRCFPGDSRPDDFVTIPRFALREGRRLLAGKSAPSDPAAWRVQSESSRQALRDRVFGGWPQPEPPQPRSTMTPDGAARRIQFQPESGVTLAADQLPATGDRVAVLLDLDGAERAAALPIASELRRAGWSLITLDLRATGRLAQPSDQIGRAPDHNTAEWSMWVGRPLLGQWVVDLRALLDSLTELDGKLPAEVALVGQGPAGLVAICAAALDSRIGRVAAVNTLSSFLTDVPYEGQRLGILAPGIVRDVGDVTDLVSLVAPRRVIVAGGVAGSGRALTLDEVRAEHARSVATWRMLGAPDQLRFSDARELAGQL